MLVTRWTPFAQNLQEFHRLRNEVDRLFEQFSGGNDTWRSLAVSYPALNVWEDGDYLYAEAELPGMELSDLEIFVTGDNQLTIKGERKPPTFENSTWHRQERGFGQFTRVLTLPVSVNADAVSAEFCHGVLTIKMPKSEASKPRRIPVKAE